eukprot:SAG31_NODE_1885_length_6990_cov_2.445218_3_plen_91_part_00
MAEGVSKRRATRRLGMLAHSWIVVSRVVLYCLNRTISAKMPKIAVIAIVVGSLSGKSRMLIKRTADRCERARRAQMQTREDRGSSLRDND